MDTKTLPNDKDNLTKEKLINVIKMQECEIKRLRLLIEVSKSIAPVEGEIFGTRRKMEIKMLELKLEYYKSNRTCLLF